MSSIKPALWALCSALFWILSHGWILGATFFGSACLPAALIAGTERSPLTVTVTVPPLAWLVSEVAGPEVVVENLVEVGEMPETFQPTDLRITRLARSAVLFRIGIPMENGPWLRGLEESGSLRVVDLRQGLTLRAMKDHHHDSDHHHGEDRSHRRNAQGFEARGHGEHGESMDPHIWLSPRRLEVMAANIARTLATVDPGRADQYGERAATVETQLRALDAELRDRLVSVRGRAFFIYHPSWGYFADDYGLRQVAVEIEGKEPTDKELTRLVSQARTLEMRTLFVQPQIRSATPHILARVIGANVETLDPLAADLPENLRFAAGRILAALLPAEVGE